MAEFVHWLLIKAKQMQLIGSAPQMIGVSKLWRYPMEDQSFFGRGGRGLEGQDPPSDDSRSMMMTSRPFETNSLVMAAGNEIENNLEKTLDYVKFGHGWNISE